VDADADGEGVLLGGGAEADDEGRGGDGGAERGGTDVVACFREEEDLGAGNGGFADEGLALGEVVVEGGCGADLADCLECVSGDGTSSE
jgi:hypothetical protein